MTSLSLAGNGLSGASFSFSGRVTKGSDSQIDGIQSIVGLISGTRSGGLVSLDVSECGLGDAFIDRLSAVAAAADCTGKLVCLNVLGNVFSTAR